MLLELSSLCSKFGRLLEGEKEIWEPKKTRNLKHVPPPSWQLVDAEMIWSCKIQMAQSLRGTKKKYMPQTEIEALISW